MNELASNKLVSVIIPVFNVEKYVEEAVKSIQEQTYRNIELIIVDDCSTDNTYEIVKKLSLEDQRIKLYKNETNLKIAKTLNIALEHANGYYIARMDGDDISHPKRIERKINFLEKNTDYDLVGCSIISIDRNGNEIGKTKYTSNQKIIKKSLKYFSPVSHIWVSKKSTYEKLNGYRELSGVEDYDFLLRMVSLGLKFTNLEDNFDYYVRLGREGNTVSSIGVKQKKMHYYAYNLYKERNVKNKDTFSQSNLSKMVHTSYLTEKLHVFSSSCLFKAIKFRSQNKLAKTIFYTFLSLSSIYQVKYLIERIILKSIHYRYK
ncbi:glycosyltransferase family 2 protein [Providencia huaxiensis]|uniref:glycosyltransferase family 2 protein n=1 Tax=Providencia huaxiensis TaxID=2027290 RepID=UPI0032DBD992